MMSDLPDSFEDLYDLLEKGDARAALLLDLRRMLSDRCAFDPVTGLEVEQGTAQFAARELDRVHVHDYLWYIVSHALEAFRRLTDDMRSNILREHIVMPAYRARELDTSSAIWLSRRPGRNVREKINQTQGRLMAVRRRFSHDTVENRLLKAFAKRILMCLERYLRVHGPEAEPCMEEMHRLAARWLRSEEAEEIGEWRHVPPNNTLLQHRLYRKIWDAWLRLLRMDGIVKADSENLCANYFLSLAWDIIARLGDENFGGFRLLQRPMETRYADFRIEVAGPITGWMPQAADPLLGGVPLAFEILPQGLRIRVGTYRTVEVGLSEDGQFCKLPDGSLKADIWNERGYRDLVDAAISELQDAEDKLLATLVSHEIELRAILGCPTAPPSVMTNFPAFNELYRQIVQAPWENMARRMHAFCKERGAEELRRGLLSLSRNIKFMPDQKRALRALADEVCPPPEPPRGRALPKKKQRTE